MMRPVIHKMELSIPYGLKPEELLIDETSPKADWRKQLQWMVDEAEEGEVPRILRAAVEIYVYNNGFRTIGECLDTAIVWERG